MNKIFIQIASYRDPELLPTINSCIDNSDNPDNLVFGICWQKDESETLGDYESDPRFKLLRFHYSESRGTCWARNKIQELYNNEEYTLQLDSHHRFIEGWDTLLINMFKGLREKGIKKPLITTYLPAYEPKNDPNNRTMTPTRINYKETCKDGSILFSSSYIDNYKILTEPIEAKFYSAHFCFTSGDFCIKVKHDPNYYFTGEEMNLTIRAYTNGYDLFHPHILVAWHEYTRNYRTKHWDDNSSWWKIDRISKMRNRILFNMELPQDDKINNKEEYFGEYWFGKERTIEDYEKYSGITFKYNVEPAIDLSKKSYSYEFQVPEYESPQFLYLGFQDNSGKELYRLDITDFSKKTVTVNFESTFEPYKYIWWPYHNGSGWGKRIDVIL
jgi:Glycosyltransferase (GlcNAc)